MCFIWRPWFRPVQSIYYLHTTHYSRILTNWNKLFLRDIYTKSWYGHASILDDLILPGFRCAFSCMVQHSLCHGMDKGTCAIVHWSAAPHHRIAYRTGFWMCAVLVLNVIMIFIMIVVNIIGIFMALNYHLIYTLGFLYISCSGSANAQLPGCFRPWTFSFNIGLNTFPLDSLTSCLHSLLGYSTGEFQALQLIVLAAFGAVD